MFGPTKVGLDFYEDSAFWGVECEVKDVVEHEVDQTVDIPHDIWASEQVEAPPFL